MTRQVAIAAVVAFGITVLVLSIWKPRADVPPTQASPVPAAPQPPAAMVPMTKRDAMRFAAPKAIRPELGLHPLVKFDGDAGTP